MTGRTVIGESIYASVENEGVIVDLPQAFRWMLDDGMQPLGFLQQDGEQTNRSSSARAIDADGFLVVGFSTSRSGLATISQAFSSLDGGELVGLGAAEINMPRSEAFGVSGNGEVIVGVTTADLSRRAIAWRDGELQLLPNAAGGNRSEARDVSLDGSVIVGIGNSTDSPLFGEALRWVDGQPEPLGFLDEAGFRASQAEGVSPAGDVVVGASVLLEGASIAKLEAFRWSEGEGMVGLGLLPEGGTSEAVDVTAAGDMIVGRATTPASQGSTAVIWRDGGGRPAFTKHLDSREESRRRTGRLAPFRGDGDQPRRSRHCRAWISRG